MIAVLDTGGVTALTPTDEQSRARLRALRRRAADVVISSAVLAEGLLTGHPGRDYHVRRLLDTLAVVEVDEALGLAAGSARIQAIRAGAEPAPSGVDAIVAALADRHSARDDVVIITGDHDHIQALAQFGNYPDRVSITRV